MMSFEIKRPATGQIPEELEIYVDRNGLESLLAQLGFLRDGRTDHVHLMSTSWGGVHLEDQPQTAEFASIHHVKIFFVD